MTQREKDALFTLIRYSMGIDKDIPETEKENIKELIPVLYEESKRQDLAHMVGDALFSNNLISADNEFFEKFKKRQIGALYRGAMTSQDIKEICEVFEQAAIPFMPLKGSVLRNLYPEKWMRTSSDIDVLVKPEDLRRAVSTLIDKLGYSYVSNYIHHVSLCSKNGIHIELHHELLEECTANDANLILGDIWNLIEPKQGYSYWHEMKDEHFYLYHIAHAAKHVINGGCGIKPILDLWILENKVDYNKDLRSEMTKVANLSAFENMCLELSRVWFDKQKSPKKEIELFGDYIITGGVYGTPLNHLSIQQQRKGGKKGYAKYVLFPPYDTMAEIFPILKKHKYLTALFYVVRFFLSVFKGTAPKVMKRLKANSKSPKKIDDAIRLLLEKSELR